MQIKDTYVNWYAKPLPSSTAHSFFLLHPHRLEEKRNLLLYLTQTLYHLCVCTNNCLGAKVKFHSIKHVLMYHQVMSSEISLQINLLT